MIRDTQVPLSALPAGEVGLVRALTGGRGLVARLAALGFIPGTEVMMLQNFGRGPLLVAVRNTRVALGRGEAARIWVSRKRG
ncbi:MAG: ferrous iron transport protein A [Candidatus Acetothermia bacterium]|jgi:ferrous iron transport protein A|nr:ferrous iron transport protein A [Candidatus Acetothermia bacterium]MDH7505079.1 FeoA family protein [Candidatus Acetothermia bacterium]